MRLFDRIYLAYRRFNVSHRRFTDDPVAFVALCRNEEILLTCFTVDLHVLPENQQKIFIDKYRAIVKDASVIASTYDSRAFQFASELAILNREFSYAVDHVRSNSLENS